MRLKKPTRAMIDQVRITREGNDAIIDYANAGIAGTRLTIGPDIATMTDREIIDVFNGILAAQERLLAAWDKTVTEEPPGEKQIDYHEDSDQWVPRGDVLRCIIDDGGPEWGSHHPYRRQRAVAGGIRADVTGSCGLGMRIAFVPEEFIWKSKGRNPKAQAADGSGNGCAEERQSGVVSFRSCAFHLASRRIL